LLLDTYGDPNYLANGVSVYALSRSLESAKARLYSCAEPEHGSWSWNGR